MRHKLMSLTVYVTLLVGNQASGEELKEGFSNESELSVVTISGNSNSESYAGKSLARIKDDGNIYSLKGRYIDSRVSGQQSSKVWELTGRYERQLSEYWGYYVAYGSESDRASGYLQRDNADIGAKYFLIKSEPLDWITELGYRLTKTQPTTGDVINENFGRVYTEVRKTLRSDLLAKFWVEYLPNFRDPQAYLVNLEPSLMVTLSEIFSMKTSYLYKYNNGVRDPLKKGEAFFTTSLVAKF